MILETLHGLTHSEIGWGVVGRGKQLDEKATPAAQTNQVLPLFEKTELEKNIDSYLHTHYDQFTGKAVINLTTPNPEQTVFFNLIDTMQSIQRSVEMDVFENRLSFSFVLLSAQNGSYAYCAEKRGNRIYIFKQGSSFELFSLLLYPTQLHILFDPREHSPSVREISHFRHVLTILDNGLLQHLAGTLSREAEKIRQLQQTELNSKIIPFPTTNTQKKKKR